MKRIYFSRNTKIAEFCKAYKYIKEFREGVDRMYRKLEKEGLLVSEFWQKDFMFYMTVKNKSVVLNDKKVPVGIEKVLNDTIKVSNTQQKVLFGKLIPY